MFTTSLATFLLTSLFWAAYTAGFVLSLKAALVDDPTDFATKPRLAAINVLIFPCMVLENWIDQLLIYISDGIVIWRAWVLFSEERWMMVFPVLLLLASIVSGIAYLALMSTLSAFIAVQLRHATLTLDLVTANLALSFATNVVATLMILYRLWNHRRMVGVKALGARPSAVQGVLITLVESGAFYCAVQLPRVILYASPVKPYSMRYYVTQAILSIASMLTAMYPTMVVVLVNRKRTMVEFFGLDTGLRRKGCPIDEEGRPVTPGHLSFAVPPSQGTTHIADISSARKDLSDSSIEKRAIPGSDDS